MTDQRAFRIEVCAIHSAAQAATIDFPVPSAPVATKIVAVLWRNGASVLLNHWHVNSTLGAERAIES